jgi:cytochrome c oxidase cbb3-type subunit III
MRSHQVFFVVASLVAITLATTACTRETPVDSQVIRPNKITDFDVLYKKNCAGCHGLQGKGGAAIGLADPVFLAIADDAAITRIAANGVPGTSMPAFAQHSGGMLTDEQIHVIVSGIRSRWAKPDTLRDSPPPPYLAQNPGDPKRGAAAFGVYCASCHGAEGRGGKAGSIAGSIVDPAYLTLVSDQGLRTTIIAGRPDMGAPDWRGDAPGKPMSPDDVSDVVAWLAAQRPPQHQQGGSR